MIAPITHEAAHHLLSSGALPGLSRAEQRRVVAHAAGCAVCLPELIRSRRATALVGESVEPVPLARERGASLRARLLARTALDARLRADQPLFTGEHAHSIPSVLLADEERAPAPPPAPRVPPPVTVSAARDTAATAAPAHRPTAWVVTGVIALALALLLALWRT